MVGLAFNFISFLLHKLMATLDSLALGFFYIVFLFLVIFFFVKLIFGYLVFVA